MRVNTRFWRESAILGACACALGLGVWVGSQSSWFIDRAAPTANGLVFENPRPISTFQLIDFDEGTFSVDRLTDRWSFVYFGYSTCGQICTETLTELQHLILALASQDNAQPIQVVFVTVDPGRDSAFRLKTYLREFDSTFIGITGDINTLAFFAAELAAPFTLVPNAGKSDLPDHSNSIMLINPSAALQAVLAPPHDAQRLLADFGAIVRWWETSR
ncbi:MAG: SCO family protein [Pseudomonadota bacterium]|nr:SCO family protein [Pseudomonadota bacterium]